ncbi:SCO family protein [Undibacterium oligocarboniphilum]|uniref:SCO family protein n=1 Tax=Undibacterium oligocarboniphilum TaxID=666702 RepID=A0A850QBY7_9BURK|nr:SCO family protein [Undibacterium oligocarboniphilum]MBC3868878.1 SCO family protein [Undibacterium oligocarboniphilum]NVO76858.1 SCO family protein [Undibacterium oligocarboniphilum]
MKRLHPLTNGLLFSASCLLLASATSVLAQTSESSASSASLAATANAKPLPGNSVYKIAATLSNQNNESFTLADKRGKPVLVSMFYNSCEFVCPMLIESMRLVEKDLTPAERDNLSMMLITFDPARDDTAALQSVASKHELNPKYWTIARTDPASVRKIAAALGIQYRLLEDGEFNHTTTIILLDGNGKIVARTQKIGVADPAFLKQVRKALQNP